MARIIRALAIAAICCIFAASSFAQNEHRRPVMIPELWQLSRGPRDESALREVLRQISIIKSRPRLTIAGVAMSEQILRTTEKSFAPGSFGNFGGGSRPFGGGNFGGPSGGGLFGGQSLPNESVKKR